MSLTEAVVSLRKALGESQQTFATRLGISIRALANYEKDRQPSGRALVALSKVAEENGHTKIAKQFESELLRQLGRGVPHSVLDAIQLQVLDLLQSTVQLNGTKLSPKQKELQGQIYAGLEAISETINQQNPLTAGER